MDLSILRYLATLVIATIPLAPAGMYDILWHPLSQGIIVVAIGIVCYIDVTMGAVLAALVIALAIQKKSKSKSKNKEVA